MRVKSGPFRLISAFVALLLALGPMPAQRARAQDRPAGQDAPPQTDANQAEPDPPARVGRLSRVTGIVTFHAAEADRWDRAEMNWPVTTGNAFWTDTGAAAEIELAGGRIVMAGGTEIAIDRLDGQQLSATVRRGTVYLRVDSVPPGAGYRLRTPRGVMSIDAPGRYEATVGDTEHPSRLTVFQGAASIGGAEGSGLRLGPRQSAVIEGADQFAMRVEPAGQDRFLARTQPRMARPGEARPGAGGAAPIPAAVEQMPGGEDLASVGRWEPNSDYGPVWYPPVAPGWVPYRTGNWAYVAPWGWTWIDAAPWGFAPFHYGRWLELRGRWAWTPGGYAGGGYPGYAAAPIYAPALVTFFGIGAGVGLALGGAYSQVGWCPLGPREVYRPWYRTSPAYVRDVNVTHVTNISNNTVNAFDMRDFRNHGAATMAPPSAMTNSQPLARVARPVPGAALAQARPLGVTGGVSGGGVAAGSAAIAPAPAAAGAGAGLARRPDIAASQSGVQPGGRPGLPSVTPPVAPTIGSPVAPVIVPPAAPRTGGAPVARLVAPAAALSVPGGQTPPRFGPPGGAGQLSRPQVQTPAVQTPTAGAIPAPASVTGAPPGVAGPALAPPQAALRPPAPSPSAGRPVFAPPAALPQIPHGGAQGPAGGAQAPVGGARAPVIVMPQTPRPFAPLPGAPAGVGIPAPAPGFARPETPRAIVPPAPVGSAPPRPVIALPTPQTARPTSPMAAPGQASPSATRPPVAPPPPAPVTTPPVSHAPAPQFAAPPMMRSAPPAQAPMQAPSMQAPPPPVMRAPPPPVMRAPPPVMQAAPPPPPVMRAPPPVMQAAPPPPAVMRAPPPVMHAAPPPPQQQRLPSNDRDRKP